jgi:23S rRNA (cytosine1962-C5)-methyltransferase
MARRFHTPHASERSTRTSPDATAWQQPWAWMKYFSYHPAVFPRMVGGFSPGVRPGDLVTVYDKNGAAFGLAFANPGARVPLRLLAFGEQTEREKVPTDKLRAAVALRQDFLQLPAQSEAYRVIFSDADQLPGLTIDRYADVLAIDVTTLAAWQRLPEWIPLLHEALGTKTSVARFDPDAARAENLREVPAPVGDAPATVRFRENGVRFEANFAEGHKTGFFCDQRDNRKLFASYCRGKSVLDLCCYTGGFGLYAKVLGGAEEVTAVDLDERAVAQARRNMNLNQARLNLVQADAFLYARQMRDNGVKFDVVVLDPPKFLLHRDERESGLHKYQDLNQLALSLVAPGGLFVTCSCSGQLEEADFEHIVIRAAHHAGRHLRFIHKTGAAPDHPVMSNCPETRYLKVLWAIAP